MNLCNVMLRILYPFVQPPIFTLYPFSPQHQEGPYIHSSSCRLLYWLENFYIHIIKRRTTTKNSILFLLKIINYLCKKQTYFWVEFFRHHMNSYEYCELNEWMNEYVFLYYSWKSNSLKMFLNLKTISVVYLNVVTYYYFIYTYIYTSYFGQAYTAIIFFCLVLTVQFEIHRAWKSFCFY